MSICTQL